MEENLNKDNNVLSLGKERSTIFSLIKDYSNPSHIPYKDKLFLSPIQKYRIYGKFPIRMILDIALAILITVQIMMISGPTMEYTKAIERFFYNAFLQNDNFEGIEVPRIKYIYTMEDLVNVVNSSRKSYYELDSISLGNLTFNYENNENNSILVIIDYIDKEKNRELIDEYNMTENDAWIFNYSINDTYRKKIINRVKSFMIEYKVNSHDPYNFGDYYECYEWDVKQIFDFERRYHISVTLNMEFNPCKDTDISGHKFIKGCFWIPSLILIISLINFIFTVRSLIIGFKYYLNFQYIYSKENIKIERENKPPKIKSKWDMLREKDKKNILSRFNYLQAIGNITQFLSAAMSLYEGKEIIITAKYILGIAAALSYLNLMKYLKYYSHFHTIILTLLKSIPYIMLYFIGALPLIIPFVVFGVANFPYSERFYSFTRVILNLFGMMNGDSLLDVINDIVDNSYFLGHIYIYLFIFLFICFVINVFVSIIEDSFVSSKIKNQDHWIHSFVQKNEDKKEDKGNISRTEMKLRDEMRRKSMIRNALRKSSAKESEKIEKEKLILNEKGKLNLKESILYFDKTFNKMKDEIKNITNEIKESRECKMKNELKKFILKRISNLQELINEENKSL